MEKDRDESRRVQEARPEVPDAHVRARITHGTGQELSRPVAPCAFGLVVLSFFGSSFLWSPFPPSWEIEMLEKHRKLWI